MSSSKITGHTTHCSLQGMYAKIDTPKVPGQSTYSWLLSFFLLPSTPFPHFPAFFPHVTIPHACCQPNLGGGSARVLNGLAPCLNRLSSFLFVSPWSTIL